VQSDTGLGYGEDSRAFGAKQPRSGRNRRAVPWKKFPAERVQVGHVKPRRLR
jgi:hypothetical protein